MVWVIRIITRFFSDRTVFLVVSCDVFVVVTNRLDVVRFLEVAMKYLKTFVVVIFSVVAIEKCT